MWMTVGDQRFAITLDHSETAREFARLLLLTLDMAELNANELLTSGGYRSASTINESAGQDWRCFAKQICKPGTVGHQSFKTGKRLPSSI